MENCSRKRPDALKKPQFCLNNVLEKLNGAHGPTRLLQEMQLRNVLVVFVLPVLSQESLTGEWELGDFLHEVLGVYACAFDLIPVLEWPEICKGDVPLQGHTPKIVKTCPRAPSKGRLFK